MEYILYHTFSEATNSGMANFLLEQVTADALTRGEGTFSLCTFWYRACLARTGQFDKAFHFPEEMLGFANHVGLYAEQLG